MKQLRETILSMAKRHEESYDEEIKEHKVSLADLSHENPCSFPAYLMLHGSWNDALDWANQVNGHEPKE